MRRAAFAAGLALALGLVVAAVGGCGDTEDEPFARPGTSVPRGDGIELSIRYDDGEGNEELALLSCRSGARRAGGFLKDKAPVGELCDQARSLSELLTTQPEKQRACTQIYGGPQTAHVTGTIDGVKVDRRFTRTNGCEIADFDRAAALLRP